MTKPGPPPTPSVILKLRGSTIADRPKEPKPEKAVPEKPRGLPKVAGRVWDQTVPVLVGMGVLTIADGGALERYCRVFARWLKAEKFLDKNGDVQIMESGYRQQQPEVNIASNLGKALDRLEAKFGLGPADRARIEVEVADKPAPVRKRERRA